MSKQRTTYRVKNWNQYNNSQAKEAAFLSGLMMTYILHGMGVVA